MLRLLGTIVAWAALACAVVGIALHYFPGRGRVTTILTAGVPFLLFGALLAVLIFIGIQRWWAMVISLIICVVAGYTQYPLFVARKPIDINPVSATTLTILQSNIWLGNGSVADLERIVRDRHVDVLTISELTPQAEGRIFKSGIHKELPYTFAVPSTGGSGSAIYSRYPLSDTANLEPFLLGNLRATMTIPAMNGRKAQPVEVFAAHPVPPYPGNPATWVQETNRLTNLLQSVPKDRPVVVGGDFNATYDYARFRKYLTNGYSMADETTGAGWLFTYPANFGPGPVIGIDHILVRDGYATSLKRVNISHTDHRAILADVVIK